MENKNDRQSEIWAVGGGKGGTGKTFVICQLATRLASRGKRVILIDTDLGAANIHTFFGIKKREKSISNFFEEKQDLENLIIETRVKNLAIIPGKNDTVSFSTIKHTQKLKLFRQIKGLDADYILLDLGGGTNFDIIDTFLMADKLILVTIPEITAVENLYQFIKNVFFRKLKSLFADCGLKDIAKDTWKNKQEYGIKTIVDLLDHLKEISGDKHDLLEKGLSEFYFNIILNKVRNIREVREGFSVKSICIKHIGVNTRYAGYIEYDNQFWQNLNLIQSSPMFIVSPTTKNDAAKTVNNIMNGGQLKIDSIKNV